MISETSTFVADSDHKIVETSSILQKIYKRDDMLGTSSGTSSRASQTYDANDT
jgi:hypothetical protein